MWDTESLKGKAIFASTERGAKGGAVGCWPPVEGNQMFSARRGALVGAAESQS